MSEIKMTKDELTAFAKQVADEATTLAVEKTTKAFETSVKRFGYNGQAAGKSAEELAKLSTKEKMVSFIKAVYNKDRESLGLLGVKAMTEGTGSAGGFVVPEEFAAEVNRVVEDFGLIPKLARKFPMGSDTLNVPRLSATVTVTYAGEATAGTGSQPTFEQVVLAAKTCIGLTPMSNELLADANISVIDLLTELFAEAIAGSMDSQGLTGTGSPFTGILGDTGVTVVQPANGGGMSTFTGCSVPDNARDLVAGIKPWALQGAAFIMHRSVWSLFQKNKASSGGDYFISAANPVLTNATQGFPTAQAGTMWGYPVYLSDKMPTTTAVSTKYVIFGNLKHVFLGMRQDIAVSISQDAVIASASMFEANMSAVRVVSRHAIAVGLPTAFAVLKTAAS